jgi:hypothetical protein
MSLALVPGSEVTFSLALDHGQFIVQDREADLDVDAYTAEAQAIGLASFNGGVVVVTDSHWTSSTELRISLATHRPSIDLTAHDRVVRAAIECKSGEFQIYSPEETGSNERSLTLPAGNYGLIVCGDGFGHANEHGDDGADRYEIFLWPDEELREPQLLG